MPKFKHGDRVVVLPEPSSPYAGKTGVIFSRPNQITIEAPTLGVESQTLSEYLVDFEDVDDDVWILESDPALAPD